MSDEQSMNDDSSSEDGSEVVSAYGEEPWRPAIDSGDLSQLQDLVQERGLAVLTKNYVNEYECTESTPLLEAVCQQHMDMVRYLLEECSSVVNVNDCSDVHDDERGYTSLHHATEANNLELVRYLIEKGCDVNAITGRYPGEKSSLHMAVEENHVDIVKYLIDTGLCDLDLKTGEDNEPAAATALMLAVDKCESLEIVQYIMDRGRWTEKEKADRATKVLPAACKNGNLEMTKYLVESCCADANAHGVDDFYGSTPLMVACKYGRLEIVQFLAETCHADVEMYGTDFWKMNPLLSACEFGHMEIIQFLIEKCGADIETARGGYTNATALHWAITSGKLDAVQYLVEKCPASVKAVNEAGETVLHAAIKSGKFDVVQCLVETGLVDIEAKDEKGNTALHKAAYCGNLDVVQLLVENCGSNIEAKNNDQWTALNLACNGGDSIAVVKYFVDVRHVNVNVQNIKGETALHNACEMRSVETVQCLVQSGRVNVNAIDTNGQTALHYGLVRRLHTRNAADDAEKWLQIAKIFATVDQTNFRTRDNDGRTILHLACEMALFQLVNYLVQECRVDVNAATNLGETALLIACRGRQVAIVQCLTSLLFADVDVADQNGRTALHWACSGVVDEERTRNSRVVRWGVRTADSDSACCEIVQCLLDTGRVNVNAQDHQGKTALHHSFVNPAVVAPHEDERQKYIQDTCFKIVQSLVESGQANVDTTDGTRQTVLHYYCSCPNIDIPRYLIEHAHANIDAMDNEGRTALHRAASIARGFGRRSSLRLVLLLVSRLSSDQDAPVCIVDVKGGDDSGHSAREESLPKRQRT